MKYVRMYAGPDGESHFEDVVTASAVRRSGTYRPGNTCCPLASCASLPQRPTTTAAGTTPPLRQYVVTLSGTWEIEISDGDIRRFGPGDILLAEDPTGKGHVNSVDGPTERLMIHAGEP